MDIKVETSAETKAKNRRWYHRNKEEYNARRRERYANDPELRQKARERAKKQKRTASTRTLKRELNGKLVDVFTTGQIAHAIGLTPQTVRNWVREGLVPDSVFEDKHLLFTKVQSNMIIKLKSVLDECDNAWSAPKVKKYVAYMKKRW